MSKKISVIIESLIVVLVVVGTVIMFSGASDGTGLTSSGLYNLKYFTVLSNEFCGIVMLIDLIRKALGRDSVSKYLKYMAVTSVGLTFAIIAFFLQPMYKELNMYKGGNLFFHLIVPVLAMIEFVFFEREDKDRYIPLRFTFIAAIPSVIYGFGYLINILINVKVNGRILMTGMAFLIGDIL